MGNAVHIVGALVIRSPEPLHIVGVLLGKLRNLRHGLDRLYGILTGSRLAREHHAGRSVIDRIGHVGNFCTGGTGIVNHGFQHLRSGDDPLAQHPLAREHHAGRSVIDRIGHVGNFCTGGTGIVNHGFQHLRSGDDPLAQHPTLSSQLLLDCRNLHKRNFHTQVATGNHNAAANRANILHVVHTGLVFDFCHDFNIAAAIGIQQFLDVQHILLAGNEGGSNPGCPAHPACRKRRRQQ